MARSSAKSDGNQQHLGVLRASHPAVPCFADVLRAGTGVSKLSEYCIRNGAKASAGLTVAAPCQDSKHCACVAMGMCYAIELLDT